MSNRDLAKSLIDQIPESRLFYVVSYLQGAVINLMERQTSFFLNLWRDKIERGEYLLKLLFSPRKSSKILIGSL